ncbi:MAG: hypothetical protein ACPGEF_05700, partial [Endozoicomonas sp.]
SSELVVSNFAALQPWSHSYGYAPVVVPCIVTVHSTRDIRFPFGHLLNKGKCRSEQMYNVQLELRYNI